MDERLPEWLRRPPGSDQRTRTVKGLLRVQQLSTVCEDARCPNIGECFQHKTATFLILGDTCTRGCRFCSIKRGRPTATAADFENEAARVAQAAAALGLRYVVLTSVTRDDLPDGGASGFVATITALRQALPGVRIEVLIPDFCGDEQALHAVLRATPDVLNHNLETVPRLYRTVRPGAQYQRSLALLQRAKELLPTVVTKTGIMLGLGETEEEVCLLMADCRAHGVESFTAGQYVRPTRTSLPVVEYLPPFRFEQYTTQAWQLGFSAVAIGPLVRSSYHAAEGAEECLHNLRSSFA